MIISLRNNARMLRRKNMFKKESTFLRTKKEYYKAAEGKVDLKELSPIELKRIRETIKYNRRESLKHSLIIFLFVVPVVLYVGNAILKTTSFYPYPANVNSNEDTPEKKQSDYLFFITDGDEYIEKKEWHNAIFQYQEALKIFPKEFDANYRLALAYTYSCSYESENCAAAAYAIARLEEDFQKNGKVQELKAILDKI